MFTSTSTSRFSTEIYIAPVCDFIEDHLVTHDGIGMVLSFDKIAVSNLATMKIFIFG